MLQKFTDRFIASLKPPGSGRREVRDSEAPGLAIRVTAAGEKSWAVRYSPKDAPQRRATIGLYPGLSLSEARAKAYDIAAAAKRGIDLVAGEERARLARLQTAGRPQTVRELTRKYVEDHAKANHRRWKLTERIFQMHVDPKIGPLLLDAVRRADVVTLLDDLQNKKKLNAQVNRVRSLIIAAFNWAIEREWMQANPAAIVRKRRIEHSRTRVLTDNEIRAIWKAAVKIGYPGGNFLRALMLCCQRRNEVQEMPRKEIKDDGSDWIIPASRNKGKRDHLIPLSTALRELFAGTPEGGPYMFSANGEHPYAGQVRLKRILDRECGVSDWTFHDIRRTVSTRMAELGVSLEVRRHLLNHARPKLDQVYNVYEFRAEKLRALEAWAERLRWIVSDNRDAKVVPLRR